jgi:hypothetical protein
MAVKFKPNETKPVGRPRKRRKVQVRINVEREYKTLIEN